MKRELFNKASIIIPNYNGKDLLSECLPSVIKAIDLDEGHEIIVVDDGSSDGSVSFLEKNFPSVRIILLDKNVGFGAACNIGVQKSMNPVVVLLNSDIKVSKEFLLPLLEAMKNEDIFAVSGKVFQWDEKSVYVERTTAKQTAGMLTISTEPADTRQMTLYAGGGMAAFDREKFLSLGGFDDLYSPFYYEDLDLSYRAWKKGWKVLYEPKSVMYHKHAATINRTTSPFMVRVIKNKNLFLFTWRNINDSKLLLPHFFFLPFQLLKWIITLKPAALLGFMWALTKTDKVIKKRNRQEILSDSEILGLNRGDNNERAGFKENLKYLYHRNWEKFHVIRRIEWETIGSWLAPAKGEKILDAGCGTGYFSRLLCLKGCLVHGIDLSVNAIKNASKYNKEPSAFFSRGDALELPYSTSAFDKAVSVCCLEHFTDDEKALQELNRILIDNGRLVLSVDAYNSRWIDESFRQKCAKAFSIEQFYDAVTISDKLHRAGFSCLRHQYLFHSKTSSALFRLAFYYDKLRYLYFVVFPMLYITSKLSDFFPKTKTKALF